MVLYRKYRPQNFAQLIGLEEIKKALVSARTNGKISHAYLFSGPRGTGKTTTARILAKIINCQNLSSEGEPCNSCNSCLGIQEGRFLDLLEIDAASNRGIDDIRDLREKIKLAPTQGEFKVYIIDEVHMLTTEAFNALLKTLEEPPPHAVFILCTTELHKLPATILSRCLRFEFKMPDQEDLVSLLSKVAQEEKIILDDQAVSLIAKEARGAYRDALVLLEKYAATGKLEANLYDKSHWEFIINFIKGEKPKETVESLNFLIQSGVSLRSVVENLTEVLRLLLLIKVGVRIDSSLFPHEEWQELENLSKNSSKERITSLIEILLRANENLKISLVPSLPVEMAIIEASLLEEERDGLEKEFKEDHPVSKEVKVETEVGGLNLKLVKDKWKEILNRIKPLNRSLEALLRNCEPGKLEDGFLLTLKVSYKFHKGILEELKNRNLVEKILSQYFETNVKIKCVLGEKKVRVKPEPVEKEPKVEKLEEDQDLLKMAPDLFSN